MPATLSTRMRLPLRAGGSNVEDASGVFVALCGDSATSRAYAELFAAAPDLLAQRDALRKACLAALDALDQAAASETCEDDATHWRKVKREMESALAACEE